MIYTVLLFFLAILFVKFEQKEDGLNLKKYKRIF